MAFEIESEHLGAIKVIHTEVYEDERGFFQEVYQADSFSQMGIPDIFVQDNHSRSVKDVVRGLHVQWNPLLGKLMRVIIGSAFLVAVDIRKGSPTLGEWFGLKVSADNRKQVWAPPGFARGFCVLSEVAEIQYKCTGTWNKACEPSILWNDPEIGIDWPTTNPILSGKDRSAQRLKDWLERPEAEYFAYDAASEAG